MKGRCVRDLHTFVLGVKNCILTIDEVFYTLILQSFSWRVCNIVFSKTINNGHHSFFSLPILFSCFWKL